MPISFKLQIVHIVPVEKSSGVILYCLQLKQSQYLFSLSNSNNLVCFIFTISRMVPVGDYHNISGTTLLLSSRPSRINRHILQSWSVVHPAEDDSRSGIGSELMNNTQPVACISFVPDNYLG